MFTYYTILNLYLIYCHYTLVRGIFCVHNYNFLLSGFFTGICKGDHCLGLPLKHGHE